MKPIDKIIFNELASRRAVALPGLGTLGVVRRPAQITGKDVNPPVNQVVYSKEEAQDATSVIMLMETMGVSRDAAETAYTEWKEEVCKAGEISLDGVGVVKEDVFTPSPELAQMLNPGRQRPTQNNAQPVTDQNTSRCCNRCLCLANVMMAAAILMLIIVGCIHLSQCNSGFCKNQTEELKPLHTVVSEQPTAVIPQADAVITPQQPAVAVSGQYHLIAGSFVYEYNADELIADLTRTHPDLNLTKIETTSWIMVSVFQDDDIEAVAATNRRLSDVLNNYEMWIYKSK